jgi:hypothetical protein
MRLFVGGLILVGLSLAVLAAVARDLRRAEDLVEWRGLWI